MVLAEGLGLKIRIDSHFKKFSDEKNVTIPIDIEASDPQPRTCTVP